MIVKIIPSLFSCTLLLACATPEWRQADRECEITWSARIPTYWQDVWTNETYPVEVPTGRTNCTSNRFGDSINTNCQQVTRTEWRTRPVLRTIDMNAPQRGDAIRACVVQTCNARYGNPQCKPSRPRPELTTRPVSQSNP